MLNTKEIAMQYSLYKDDNAKKELRTKISGLEAEVRELRHYPDTYKRQTEEKHELNDIIKVKNALMDASYKYYEKHYYFEVKGYVSISTGDFFLFNDMAPGMSMSNAELRNGMGFTEGEWLKHVGAVKCSIWKKVLPAPPVKHTWRGLWRYFVETIAMRDYV